MDNTNDVKSKNENENGTKKYDKCVKYISMVLNEKNTCLLRSIFIAIGVTSTFKLFKRVIDIMDNGGLFVQDGSKKRTAGEVFFYLLREEMSPNNYKRIMNLDKKSKESTSKPCHKKNVNNTSHLNKETENKRRKNKNKNKKIKSKLSTGKVNAKEIH
tara:strand:+ start:2162 stop:2635 length:474 start_codon:yes stop_codon:yes gene_type:complete